VRRGYRYKGAQEGRGKAAYERRAAKDERNYAHVGSEK